jgi:hypothetical protein
LNRENHFTTAGVPRPGVTVGESLRSDTYADSGINTIAIAPATMDTQGRSSTRDRRLTWEMFW